MSDAHRTRSVSCLRGFRYGSFVEFVLAHYVHQGVQELDSEKLTPLLCIRYGNSLADASADLGKPSEIREVFVGFQRHLYRT